MISDATYTVTCDKCQAEEVITPEVFHRDYSGKSPMICLDDNAIEKEVKKIGWAYNGDDDLSCEDCSETENDEDGE